MGALLNHLPLAQTLFRATSRALQRSGAGTALAGLGLGVLLAPMNGSVGASVATLGRTVFPRLDAAGMPAEKSAALVCVASTLGVVVPPSLVLILLSDAMMRAHTEALNATGAAVRIINTQDVFAGALVPAAILLAMYIVVTWGMRQRKTEIDAAVAPRPAAREWATAGATAAFVVGLLIAVTLGYLYAVEAAAAGGVVLVLFGLATRTLTRSVLREVRCATRWRSPVPCSPLLVGATRVTLILRALWHRPLGPGRACSASRGTRRPHRRRARESRAVRAGARRLRDDICRHPHRHAPAADADSRRDDGSRC